MLKRFLDFFKKDTKQQESKPIPAYIPDSQINHIFIPGAVIGKLTVLRPVFPGKFCWYICLCECGRENKYRADILKNRPFLEGCKDCVIKSFHDKMIAATKVAEVIKDTIKPKSDFKVSAGKVVGNWNVLERIDKKNYFCECTKCGIQKIVKRDCIEKSRGNGCWDCFQRTPIAGIIKKSKLRIGDKFGEFTVLKALTQKKALFKCSCGIKIKLYISDLKNRKYQMCQSCGIKEKIKENQKLRDNKNITSIETKDEIMFEKLPQKLNISIPKSTEFDAYINQAEELLKDAADIYYDNKFKTPNGWLKLYWSPEIDGGEFRLLATETTGFSTTPNNPPAPLSSCDLRIKMRACNNCLKEFLELYEMHISDYLEGKHNGN